MLTLIYKINFYLNPYLYHNNYVISSYVNAIILTDAMRLTISISIIDPTSN